MLVETGELMSKPTVYRNTIQHYINHLGKGAEIGAYAQVESALQDVQALEYAHYSTSRFRRLSRCMEPLVDFLLMYSPAVDILVQFDVSPSAVIWGAVRSLLKIAQNSIKYYDFITRMIAKLTDIVSVSTRYQELFSEDERVIDALAMLHLQVLKFLQRIRAVIDNRSFNVVVKSLFRPVEVEFQNDLQWLSRAKAIFETEVTLAHREHIEIHIKEQRFLSSNLNRQNSSRKPQSGHALSESYNEGDFAVKRSIFIWLGLSNHLEALRRATSKRCSHTGEWLLENPVYQQWTSSSSEFIDSRLLWIYGAPGAGKTVLCGTTIENVQTMTAANDGLLTYFFIDRTDQANGTSFHIFTSIISQILSQLPQVPEVLVSAYRASVCHGRTRISEAEDVYDLLVRVALVVSDIFIVIDALDECMEAQQTISWLTRLIESVPNLRVLCFSRDTGTTRKNLSCYPSLKMDVASIRPDIDKYLRVAVETLPCTDSRLRDCVFDNLSTKADGMFLFTDLSIQTLRSAVDVDDMLNVLETMPSGINDMYDLILKRLCTETRARQYLAQRVFLWVCTALRPMTWAELRVALSWDPEVQKCRKDKEPFRDAVLELCCPLVEYDEPTDTFRLVHASVYEYLCETPRSSPLREEEVPFFIHKDKAHGEVTAVALAYIMEDSISRSVNINAAQYPLLSYATKYWCHHISQAPFEQRLYALFSTFAQDRAIRITWILRWLLSAAWASPLQQVVTLQKLAQSWAIESNETLLSLADILSDIQEALFSLDKIHSQIQSQGQITDFLPISNFERLVCVRDLAREYTMSGELGTGIAAFEQAVARQQELDGKITAESCWILNSLGILYDQQGKIKAAKETQERALACQESSLPPHHLDIVLTINELGRIARHLEQFDEAERLHREALSILETLFPESDLQITWTKSALGRALLKQSLPNEALALHEQVLAVETTRLGRAHPHTMWTLSDIARCYRDQGKLEDAIAAQKEVMERNEQVLGGENPDTLWATNSLALLYEAHGRLDLAKSLHSKALEGQRTRLGENHKHTCWSREAVSRLDEAT